MSRVRINLQPKSCISNVLRVMFVQQTSYTNHTSSVQFSRSVMSDSVTPPIIAYQASLSITNSQSLLRFMSIESVMPSIHLILCHPLLLPPSIFPSIRVFSNESVLYIRWPKYWSFSFSISPFNECSGLISFRMDWYSAIKKMLFAATRMQLEIIILSQKNKYYVISLTCEV